MLLTLTKTRNDSTIFYYTIHDRQRLLTHPYSISLGWRTMQGKGREITLGFATLEEKNQKIKQVFQTKIKQGYVLLYSYINNQIPSVTAINDIITNIG